MRMRAWKTPGEKKKKAFSLLSLPFPNPGNFQGSHSLGIPAQPLSEGTQGMLRMEIPGKGAGGDPSPRQGWEEEHLRDVPDGVWSHFLAQE